MQSSGTLEVVKLIISSLGLLSLFGTVCLFLSLRAAAFGSVYQRFQNLMLWFAQNPEIYAALVTERYDPAESPKQLFAASAMLNMYEESYNYYSHRVFFFFGRLVSQEFYESVRNAQRLNMKKLRYVRTYWQVEKARFSRSFNRFMVVELGIAEEE